MSWLNDVATFEHPVHGRDAGSIPCAYVLVEGPGTAEQVSPMSSLNDEALWNI